MYVLGTSEPLLLSFPELQICGLGDDPEGLPTNNIILYGYLILAFCATVITLGVKYVSRVAPFVLIPVLLSVALIWLGCWTAGVRDFDPSTGITAHWDYSKTFSTAWSTV